MLITIKKVNSLRQKSQMNDGKNMSPGNAKDRPRSKDDTEISRITRLSIGVIPHLTRPSPQQGSSNTVLKRRSPPTVHR